MTRPAMDQQQQQHQPQQHTIHDSILHAIERLSSPISYWRNKRHSLFIGCSRRPHQTIRVPVDRQSLEYLVHFLDNRESHEEVISQLELCGVEVVSHPSSDGGLNVLRDFFARRSDTTLTKVTMSGCNFGSTQNATQLLAAFHTNRTVTDLSISKIHNIQEGTALCTCLSSLMLNMPQLQRLCTHGNVGVDGVRAFQPALQVNRTLRELNLWSCNLGDDEIRLIADSLAGNDTIEILNIGFNVITFNGLDDITRMLASTRLQNINLQNNQGLFGGSNNESSTMRFARVLSRHEFLKYLNLGACGLGDYGIRLIADAVVGNNTIMEALDIRSNTVSFNCLADITRLLVSTQLKTCCFAWNPGLFYDESTTQHFLSTLQHELSSVQELPRIDDDHFPNEVVGAAILSSINNSLTRNRQLNHVNLLLAPPPSSPHAQQQLQQRNATTMMLKVAHKAITKFAKVPNNAGASAIFKLFQARPQLLEKRLKRPASAVTAAAPTAPILKAQKRQCL